MALLLLASGTALRLAAPIAPRCSTALDRLGTPVAIYTFGNAEERKLAREGGYDMQERYQERGGRYAAQARYGDRYGDRYGERHGDRYGDRYGQQGRYGDMRRGQGFRGRYAEPPYERYGMTGSLRQDDVQSPYGIRGRESPYGRNGPFDREQGSFGMRDMYSRGRPMMRDGMMRDGMMRDGMMRDGMGMRRSRYGAFDREPFERFDMQRMPEMEGRMYDGYGRNGRFSDYGMQVIDRYGGVGRRGHLELD